MEINTIVSFLTNPPFSRELLILKIIFLVFSLILFIIIVLLFLKTSWFKLRFGENIIEFFTYQPMRAKKVTKQWLKIKRRLETGLESEYKLAVIETDSLFDNILKKMGYSGETLGERLKKITPDILTNIEEIWAAHKIRNNIVHDPDYRLNLDEAKKTILIYEKALTELEVL